MKSTLITHYNESLLLERPHFSILKKVGSGKTGYKHDNRRPDHQHGENFPTLKAEQAEKKRDDGANSHNTINNISKNRKNSEKAKHDIAFQRATSCSDFVYITTLQETGELIKCYFTAYLWKYKFIIKIAFHSKNVYA